MVESVPQNVKYGEVDIDQPPPHATTTTDAGIPNDVRLTGRSPGRHFGETFRFRYC